MADHPASREALPMDVDYRNPEHLTRGGKDRIVGQLQKHDTMAAGRTILVLVAGAAWCAIVVSVVAGGVAALLGHFEVRVPFIAIWGVTATLVLPWAFWYESRTAGRFYEDGAAGLPQGRANSYGEWELRTTEASWLAYIELALSGPRWIMQGLGLRKKRDQVDRVILNRAADIVLQLQDLGEGTSVKKLARPADEESAFRRAMDYLADHDWVGRSKDRRRVWLTSLAAQRLGNAGRTVPSQ
ncbi:MAG: hypothetical protein AAGD32_16875 [Planctomycetota bacterium]